MKLTKEQCEKLSKRINNGLVISTYTEENINKVLDKCSNKMVEVVKLRLVDNMTYAEICRRTKISPQYVVKLYREFMHRVSTAHKLKWSKPEITDETSVDYLCLNTRARNILKWKNINTIGQLCNYTSTDLRSIHHCGKKSLNEIEEKLSVYGFHLKSESKTELVSSYEVEPDSFTKVLPNMLNVVYAKCKSRTEKYGYERSCITCPYRGTNGADCMFAFQPRIWTVKEVKKEEN